MTQLQLKILFYYVMLYTKFYMQLNILFFLQINEPNMLI